MEAYRAVSTSALGLAYASGVLRDTITLSLGFWNRPKCLYLLVGCNRYGVVVTLDSCSVRYDVAAAKP